MYWTGLPGRVRADVGLFREQIGDLNRWHLHALPESEYPLVYRRFLGDEGLSGAGLSLYTTLPLSIGRWHPRGLVAGHHRRERAALRHRTTTAPCSAGCRTSGSSPAAPTARSASPRWAVTTRDSVRGRVLGADLRLTWRPPNAGTRKEPHLSRRGVPFRGHMNSESRHHPVWRLRRPDLPASQRWILGTRYDYVEAPRGPFYEGMADLADDHLVGERIRLSPPRGPAPP